MSLQTELNKIVEFMREQAEPAYETVISSPSGLDLGWCRYRAPKGWKCALGCRISDEQVKRYELDRESNNSCPAHLLPLGLRDEMAVVVEESRDKLFEFYADMQSAHDGPALRGYRGAAWLACFEERAREIANTWDLTYPEPAA